MPHTHECPQCGSKWECGDANYQDECPFSTEALCMKCLARGTADKKDGPLDRKRKEMTVGD